MLFLSIFPEVPVEGRVAEEPGLLDAEGRAAVGLRSEPVEGRAVDAGFDWVEGRVADDPGLRSGLVAGRVAEVDFLVCAVCLTVSDLRVCEDGFAAVDFLSDEFERLTDLPDDF